MAPLNGNLKIVLTLLALVASIVASYTLLSAQADANAEDVEDLKAEDLIQWLDIDRNSDRSIRIEVQMTHIKATVDKIFTKVEKLHE